MSWQSQFVVDSMVVADFVAGALIDPIEVFVGGYVVVETDDLFGLD